MLFSSIASTSFLLALNPETEKNYPLAEQPSKEQKCQVDTRFKASPKQDLKSEKRNFPSSCGHPWLGRLRRHV